MSTQSVDSPIQPPTRRPWIAWLLFFLQFTAIGVFTTYINIYYRQVGLSGSQIGLLNMIGAMVTVGGSMLWGYLSDRYGIARWLIAGGAVGALVINQFIPIVHTFEAILGLICLATLFNSAPSVLVDSATLALLGERREEYGLFRMGGSIGYVVSALTAGFIFDKTGLLMIFPAYAVTMGLFALAALFLPIFTAHLHKEHARIEMGALVRSPAWLLFLCCIFLGWIATNSAIQFLGVALNAMGASQSLVGISSTVGAIVEIPVMIFSAWLLKRFGSARMLTVGLILMVARYFLMGWMPTPEWSIAINLLNGPAFGFFWNGAVTYANKLAPRSLIATTQGMVSSTINLGGVVGSLLTGWLFDILGNQMFTVMGFFCLVALALFIIGSRVQRPVAEEAPAG